MIADLRIVGTLFLEQARDLWPFYLGGVLFAAFIKTFKWDRRIRASLVRYGRSSILVAVAAGLISPPCSCGILPVVIALAAAGVPLPPVMALLITSPIMSPDAFLVTVGQLGWKTKSGWVVTKFTARQAPSAAVIRMRRYRNKLRNVTHNENVTVLNQNQTQNQNQNQNQTQKREDDDGIVFEMFENNICLLNARMAEQLGDAIDTYGRDRVIEGIKIASDNNGRTVKYLLTVLENRKNGKDFRKKKPKDMNSQEARERYGEWEK